MKASELRVGNYIYWNIPEKQYVPHKIKAILLNSLHTSPISFGEYEDYIPIKLNTQWLLAAGFEWDIFYQKHTDGRLCINWFQDHIHQICWCKRQRDDLLLIEKPKYVHQLQNLYHALTGQEIQFDLTKIEKG